MKLTTQQIQLFQTNGFLVLKHFASTDRCDAIHAKAQVHLNEQIAPVESEQEYQGRTEKTVNVRRLRQVYDREVEFAQWMTDESIRPVLKQLLDDEARLLLAHHNSIMTKLPHKSSVTTWHQDLRYWHYETDNLLTVWLSLGDEYIENGLLEFIPGSHKMDFKAEQFDEKTVFREDYRDNQAIIAKRVHHNLEKGDVVLFHAKTLHHAQQNSTDKTKFSFVYTVRGQSNSPVKNTRSDYKEIIL